MSFVKVSTEEISMARKAGFKKKKPTKPKGKLTELKVKTFKDKHNAWAKEVKAYAAKQKATEKLKAEIAGL